jgi:hypothetical protein
MLLQRTRLARNRHDDRVSHRPRRSGRLKICSLRLGRRSVATRPEWSARERRARSSWTTSTIARPAGRDKSHGVARFFAMTRASARTREDGGADRRGPQLAVRRRVAGVLRRMAEGRGAVLARLHEAEPRVALWQPALVRLSGIRRLSRLCGSRGWHRVRVRDEPDGHDIHPRPARCGAQREALLRSPEFMRAPRCARPLTEGDGAHVRRSSLRS